MLRFAITLQRITTWAVVCDRLQHISIYASREMRVTLNQPVNWKA